MPKADNKIHESRKLFLKQFILELISQTKERQKKELFKKTFPNRKINHVPAIPATTPTYYVPEVPIKTFNPIEELNSLIKNPEIQSIECPGPEKVVVINKNGKIEPTSIILSKKEIYSYLKDISKKTGKPLKKGFFRTSYDNLIISAVISEYIGTRFIIQKTLLL